MREIQLAGRPPILYDIASINIGISSALPPSVPGFAAHSVPAKPLGRFATAWERFVERVADGAAEPVVSVIGGGVGGIELTMAMAHRLRSVAGSTPVQVTLIESASEIMPEGPEGLRSKLTRALTERGVDIRVGAAAAEALPGAVVLASGERVPSAFTVTVAGARPEPWLSDTGLALERGFIRVGPTLQSIDDPAIFAAGDIAHLDTAPRPKAGVFAVRQAPVLAHNFRAALSSAPMKRFHPQGDYLKLISLGEKSAVATKWGMSARAELLWRWKDRIDRQFMDALAEPLAPMAPSPPEGPVADGVSALLAETPLCGGCGSKVDAATLRAGLAAAPPLRRDDVEAGPGDDAALLSVSIGAPRLILSSDHFRAFTLDPYELARIAALHALGDIWAMGGEPQAALASITLPAMSREKQAQTVREILLGARAALDALGADIAGGHTAQGAELMIGFTVTGLLPARERGLSLSGARPGDALILTKPLGLGVVAAAEMRGKATGSVWAEALALMQRPNADAARILGHSAHAMTDVTGFGLAGHLSAMMAASDTSATVPLAAISAHAMTDVTGFGLAGHLSAMMA
ncbi:MAG: selenide, water dikinase SelD, partial [Pseudomonadota bacterium]